VTVETPKITQQMGSGTASSMSSIEPEVSTGATGAVRGAATTTGALRTAGGGDAINGCVFAIFTVGAGPAVGSGKILIRAVSFFGPAWAAEPG